MNNNLILKAFFAIVFFVLVGSSCNHTSQPPKASNNDQKVPQAQVKPVIRFVSPAIHETFKAGDEIKLQVQIADSVKHLDSIQFFIDGKVVGSVRNAQEYFMLKTGNLKLGSKNVQAIAFLNGNLTEFANISFNVYAAEPPKIYGYKVIHTYPHDAGAFTQGLIYEDGFLYEGTGLKGESTLRKEKLTTGEIIKALSLPSDIFGEGITSFDDKLIQITWKAQVAFIYYKATFNLVNKLKYSMKEGWGITYNGKNLIMSDGSANLYFLDKEYLSEIGRVEVCDNHGPIEKLNELEYINGEVWANVWETDTIVRINPENGEVTGKVDCTGLLKPEDRTENTDVLNGIAYDPATKHILVTGKNWPKLFEITVYQKQ